MFVSHEGTTYYISRGEYFRLFKGKLIPFSPSGKMVMIFNYKTKTIGV